MSTRFLKTAALLVLTVLSGAAFADETPTRVGRISLTQGEVTISGEQGEQAETALVNWPVTSRNQITTGRDARTEIRIGSTAVRLDADSALDVTELEDDSLRLHLHYGSASVMVRNPEVVRGFELSTPQGIVRLQEAGRMRIDAGRRQDTTSVSVFDGVAAVDGGGSRLVVRAGKRVELTQDDVRTGLAMRDGFDEWAMLRDLRDERSESVRYVTSEMTGYEDLDQHGSWSQHSEYGPVWAPRVVSVGWAPYRDGRWTYLQPWGWTWVDHAPWGYAPFHYGRWVMIGNRWSWSPGRNVTRVVWSPALVGWVGGNNWNVSFGQQRRAAPATGWYPLSPREVYTPTYRMKHDNLRYINRGNGERRDDVRVRVRRDDHNQRFGLTVVPYDQFSRRGTIEVQRAPRAVVSTSLLLSAPALVPPVPQGVVRGRDRDGDGRADRGNGRYDNNGRNGRNGRDDTPAAPRPSPIIAVPGAPQQPRVPRYDERAGNGPEPLRRGMTTNMPTPAPALPPAMQTPPASQQVQRDDRNGRFERSEPERERRPRGAESYQQQIQVQRGSPPPQMAQPMPQQQRMEPPPQQRMPQQQRMEPPPQQRMPMPQQQRMEAPPQQMQAMPQQQRMAPAPMPAPQVQQAQPRSAPPQAQPQPAARPSEGQRRAREDMNDRR